MTVAHPLQWPQGWPRQGGKDSDRLFRGPTYQWDRVYRGLINEVRRIGGTDIVVSTNQPVRQDGYPYSQQRKIEDVGVAVYFMRNGKQMVMAQDRFGSIIGNMRSLALAIEGLRQMERHGGGTMMERAFEGFAALPAPKQWWEVLGVQPGAHRDVIEDAFRTLAKKHHPDRGGDPAQFAEITAAKAQALEARG